MAATLRRVDGDVPRLVIIAGALVALGHVALFWTLDALPFQDLPNHFTRAAIMVDLFLHHGQRYGADFVLEPQLSPYLGGDVILYALSGSKMMQCAERAGVRAVAECFADRGYRDDGTLAPRGTPGAMIEDEAKSVAQALAMVEQGIVTSVSGKRVPVAPGTLCLHGDQPGAVRFAKAMRAAFEQRGISIGAP